MSYTLPLYVALSLLAVTTDADDSTRATKGPAEATSRKAASRPAGLPHVKIDRVHRFVDVEAEVVFDRGPLDEVEGLEQNEDPAPGTWLELVATTSGLREYESLLAVKARPSHIHQALITIGLVPGAPLTTKIHDRRIEVTDPHGAPVEISVVTTGGCLSVEVPIEHWLIDRKTGKAPARGRWLFTGSVFRKIEQRSVYMADLNGTVISLVNFGDDLISLSTKLTNRSDAQAWQVNPARLPPLGTAVVLRIRATQSRPGKAGQPGATTRAATHGQPTSRARPNPPPSEPQR